MALTRYKRTVLATVCVPWQDGFAFDEDLFRESVQLLLASGLRDLYVFGTAGEGHNVSDRQYDAVVRAFVDEVTAGHEAPMVGVMSMSFPTVVERIERAAALGVDVFQITLPSWGPLNEREAFRFFAEICGRFPDLRFLHYNIARSGRVITGREYARLAAEHPNLVATKYGAGSPEVVHGLLRHAPMLRHFLTEPGFGAASAVGEPGLLASISVTNPALARSLYEAAVKGETEHMARIHADLAEMLDEVRGLVGPTAHIDGAFDKLFAKIVDPRMPLTLLPPYAEATEESYLAYRQFLAQRFPHWLPRYADSR